MTRVLGPDNKPYDFPDNMDMTAIRGVMRQKFGVTGAGDPAGWAIDATEPEKPSLGEKFVHGAGDIGRGVAQNVARLAPALNPSMYREGSTASELANEATQAIDQNLTTREGDWQRRRKESGDTGIEWARGVGQGIASAPLAFLPGGPAVQGAAMAAVQPVEDASKGFAGQKAAQIGLGAAGGKVADAAGGLVSRAINPNVSPSLKLLTGEGVKPTFGQTVGPKFARTEEALTSVFGLGDLIKDSQRISTESFNKAAYNRVLGPIGEKFDGDAGHVGVKKIGDKLSSAYDELMPTLQFMPDEQLAYDVGIAKLATDTMSDEAEAQFNKILKSVVPHGPPSGQTLKQMESQLTFEIGRFGKSPDPNHQMIADALADVRTALMDNLARANPQAAKRLKEIDTGWANLVRVERAAANSKDGVFTPEGLLAAVKASDDSVRKRGKGRGEALMQDLAIAGNEVLGNKIPDSGSAGRVLTSAGVLGLLSPKALAGAAAASLPYLPGVRNRPGFITSRGPGAAKTAERAGSAARTGLLFGVPATQ